MDEGPAKGEDEKFQWSSKIAQCRKSLKKEPANANLHYELGLALFDSIANELASGYPGTGTKRTASEAMRHLKKAIEQDGGHARAHVVLARIHRYMGRYEEAIPHARAGLELPCDEGDQYNAAEVLASSYMYIERVGEAIPILEKMIGDHPNDANILFKLASCYHATGRAEEARSTMERMKIVAPDDPRLSMLLP